MGFKTSEQVLNTTSRMARIKIVLFNYNFARLKNLISKYNRLAMYNQSTAC